MSARRVPVRVEGTQYYLVLTAFFDGVIAEETVVSADTLMRAVVVESGFRIMLVRGIATRLRYPGRGASVHYHLTAASGMTSEADRLALADSLVRALAESPFRLDPVSLLDWIACEALSALRPSVRQRATDVALLDRAVDEAFLPFARSLLTDERATQRARRYLAERPDFAARIGVAV